MKSIIGITLTVTFFVLAGCKLADIRTEEMQSQPDEAKGKMLLDKMAVRHNSAKWISFETYSLHVTDKFYGMLGNIAAPFPKATGEFQMDLIPNTFTNRATFTDEKWKNKVWGIQSWKTYSGDTDGVTFDKKNDKIIEFWLPTYQYLLELPNRIVEGDVIRYAGSRIVKDRSYELVFVSWKTDAPQKDIDQYMLWLDATTHQLEYVQYTVRDQGRIINATLEFAKYHTVEGLLIPKEMHVRFNDKKEGKKLHSVYVKDVVLNKVQRADLLLDAEGGTEGKM